MAYGQVGACLLFGVVYLGVLFRTLTGVELHAGAFAVLVFKTVVEVGASFYGFAFLFCALAYLLPRPGRPRRAGRAAAACRGAAGGPAVPAGRRPLPVLRGRRPGGAGQPRRPALPGPLALFVHDDSRSARRARRSTGRWPRCGRRTRASRWSSLRRPTREGGKPGAVNYLLGETAHRYAFFLLCDNDSVAFDPHTVERVLPAFADGRVAVVQCRNVAAPSPGYSPVNRQLARSIDAFDVFLRAYARFGWQPFVGHNAFLRTRAVLEAGGMTPGYFADDLDLTLRLNLRGYRVVYAPEVRLGRSTPPATTRSGGAATSGPTAACRSCGPTGRGCWPARA